MLPLPVRRSLSYEPIVLFREQGSADGPGPTGSRTGRRPSWGTAPWGQTSSPRASGSSMRPSPAPGALLGALPSFFVPPNLMHGNPVCSSPPWFRGHCGGRGGTPPAHSCPACSPQQFWVLKFHPRPLLRGFSRGVLLSTNRPPPLALLPNRPSPQELVMVSFCLGLVWD